jgi:superfamily II DNA/RNA helicase
LDGHNLIAQAQSGAGKTIAFVIGMLSKIISNVNVPQLQQQQQQFLSQQQQQQHFQSSPFNQQQQQQQQQYNYAQQEQEQYQELKPQLQALCIAPTRELANQIARKAIKPLSSRLPFITCEEALRGFLMFFFFFF